MLIANEDFTLEVETKDDVHIIDVYSPRISCIQTIIVPITNVKASIKKLRKDFHRLSFSNNRQHNAATIAGYFIS